MVVEGAPSSRQYERRWTVFAIAAVAMLMSSVDQTIVATALTSIQRGLDGGLNWISWIITGYALGQIVAMPLAGRLCDQYGRKRILLIAIGVFTVASLMCALAHSVVWLIVFRIAQALGGGAFLPAVTGIVADQFGEGRDRALGLLTSIFPIGGVLGPVIGAGLLSMWSWRAVFLVNVPIGAGLVVVAARFVAPSRAGRSRPPAAQGVLTLALLLLAVMYVISSFGEMAAPLLSPKLLAGLGAVVVLSTIFARHLNRATTAFIPVRLLRGQGFGTMHAMNLLFGAAVLGLGALVPTYAQARYGISAAKSGTLLTGRALVAIIVTAVAVMLLRRTAHRPPIAAGLLTMGGACLLMALRPHETTPYLWLTLAAGISGFGMGVFQPAANNAGLQLAPEDVAAIAGLRGMFRQTGGIIVVAVTSAASTRYGDAAMVLERAFFILAIVTGLSCLLIGRVPEHRGAW